MTNKEKELFKKLCSFKSDTFDEKLLGSATPAVLGQLFFNRMGAIAYGVLEKHNLLGKVNREFRNSLKSTYEHNLMKNYSFFTCVKRLNQILSDCGCKYAMLKGAYLCKYYPNAYRTSNDVDLLVHPKDVTKIGQLLQKHGFKQGNIKNGNFEPATREEIIRSKVTRGETVPYIREVNLPWMRFFEVDINFSLDYKPNQTDVLEKMLRRTQNKTIGDITITTLDNEDFLIHLCSHLYKEATTLPWIEMKRDMTLYKYCDIYMLLSGIDKKETDKLFVRAKDLNMEKICAFVVIQMSQLFEFENEYAVCLSKEILKTDSDFVDTVIYPARKTKYIYSEKDVAKRFFSQNRRLLLKEVRSDG